MIVLSAAVTNFEALLYVCVSDVTSLYKISSVAWWWLSRGCSLLQTVNKRWVVTFCVRIDVGNFKLLQGEGSVPFQAVGTCLPKLHGRHIKRRQYGWRMWFCNWKLPVDKNGDNYVKDALYSPIAHCPRQILAERECSTRDAGNAVQTVCLFSRSRSGSARRGPRPTLLQTWWWRHSFLTAWFVCFV